ncbi:hypothetical protein FHW73_002036 [Luteimonas sp. RC10]|nr:hypothetical protein [Luteimonas sp. RC10]
MKSPGPWRTAWRGMGHWRWAWLALLVLWAVLLADALRTV